MASQGRQTGPVDKGSLEWKPVSFFSRAYDGCLNQNSPHPSAMDTFVGFSSFPDPLLLLNGLFFSGLLLPGKPAALASEGILVGLTGFLSHCHGRRKAFCSNCPLSARKTREARGCAWRVGGGGISKKFFPQIPPRSGFHCHPPKERKGGPYSLTHSINSY